MQTTDVSLLEQIANEFDRGEGVRNPQELLGLMNQYYTANGKSPIAHLDEIKTRHAVKAIGDRFGFRWGSPKRMRQRLVELGIFSQNLADYSPEVLEIIIKDTIENISIPNHPSSYLKNNPYAESNRRIIAASPQAKEYLIAALASKGLFHLDEIDVGHATQSNGTILGFKEGQVGKMQQRLIEQGIFSQNLADYSPEVLEIIIKNLIETVSSEGLSSSYLAKENPYSEGNRKIIATSKQMREHILSIGIQHLDDVKSDEHATRGLGDILGFKLGNSKQMRQRLVELGIFSQRLIDYSPEVLEGIFKHIGDRYKSHLSFYLAKDNPFAEENRKVIAVSPQMRSYLSDTGIYHLDDIVSHHTYTRLVNILGVKLGNVRQMRQKLVELGVFSPRLSDSSYDSSREDICQKMIDKLGKNGPQTSFYTSLVDEETLQSNRKVILASNAVQTFFAQEGYRIDDPSTMTHKVRLFFKKHLGAEDIEGFQATRAAEEPLYRKIHKQWQLVEEDILRSVFTDNNGNEDDFISALNRQSQAAQELFGVSYAAIINKCQRMGLISKEDYGGSREAGTPLYAFPSIHAEEFPDFVKGFENYAALLTKNIIPATTPVFAFKSAAHEQFDHVTLPVRYNGVDVNNYNNAERAIISAAWHYISDNADFGRKQNGDIVIDPTTEHGLDPIMLQIQGNDDRNLVQLIFRRKFNPDNDARTTAIELAGIRPKSEIYLFKHETHPTYQNTRV